VRTWHFTTRWLLGSQFAARLLGLVNNVLLARLLAPALFGSFVQAMAVAGALAPLADAGVSAVLTRHVARRPQARFMLSAALGLRFLQGAILWVGVLAVAWWVRSSSQFALALVLAGAYWVTACFIQLLAGVARARVQAHLEARSVLLERGITVPAAAFGAVALGLTGALVGVLAGGVAGLLYLVRRLSFPRIRANTLAWKCLLSAGAPLAIGDVCHGLIIRLDILAVGFTFGDQSAGYYGGASTLLWAGMLVPGSMALALVPARSQVGSSSTLDHRILRWMLVVAGLMALLLSAGAPVWVRLLYGSAFGPAADALRVLAWAFLPAAVVAWGNAVLLVRHRTAWVAVVAAAGLTCLAVCLWWLPMFGPLFAAVAQVVTQCLMALLLWWLVRHSLEASSG